MKVILLKDIENVGKKWEVKEVRDGYARNYLFPNNMAKPATSNSLVEEAELLRLKEEARAQKALEKVEALASSLDGYELKIPMTVAEDGTLYAAVNARQIASSLKEAGFNVPQKHIKLESPIKELGEFPVTLEFDHGLESEIRVIVEAAGSARD